MLNYPIYLFDNIGCTVSEKKDHFLVTGQLAEFNPLSNQHSDAYVPYLARNGIHWETGIGLVKQKPDGRIIVEKFKVLNKKNTGSFFGVENEFYIYANSYNFNSGLKNIILKNSSFKTDNISAIYVLDSNDSDIDVFLPKANDSDNIVLEFQHVEGSHKVFIKDSNKSLLKILLINDGCRLLSVNNSWKILNHKDSNNPGVSFNQFSAQDFTALSTADGAAGSIQYNDGAGNFTGSELYWDSIEHKLLLGSNSEEDAFSVLPTSGNYDTLINQQNNNSNFIVNGSGIRNLYFDYDGRLGLNIPSGTRPQTLMHLVNMSCSEGIRLDNRSSCHAANITLFHKPSGTTISDNDVISEIYMASNSSDNTSNDIDYVRLKGVAELADDANRKGRFDIYTSDAGSYIRSFRTSSDYSRLGISTNNIELHANSGITLKHGSELVQINSTGVNISSSTDMDINSPDGTATVNASTINLEADTINIGNNSANTVSLPIASATELSSNTIIIPTIAEDNLLSIDENNQIVAATSPKLPITANKVLTTATNGYITGIYDIDEFFRTDNDINWYKYPTRLVTIYNRQIIFQTSVSFVEYEVGDQIELLIDGVKTYRTIGSVFVDDGIVTELTVGQSLGNTELTDIEMINITKGGYFVMGKNVAPGTVSDASQNILSSRAGVDTTFNQGNKEIDFRVYGTDPEPALYVKANVGKINTPSGFYHPFAMSLPKCEPCPRDRIAQEYDPFPITLNASGEGISNSNNSANYNRTNENADDVLYTGLLSDVGTNGRPSFIGTYDQNGNVYEWIDDNAVTSRPSFIYAAGGSWKTSASGLDFSGNDIQSSGLRSLQSLNAISGYDDVGLRIASIPGLETPAITSYIENATGLNLDFATVGYENNIADSQYIYEYSEDDDKYIPSEIFNLGNVKQKYRIGKYPVTNAQYVDFLNAVAQYNDRGLYDSRMGSETVGGISRYRSSSGSPWEYSVKTGMDNKPLVFIDYISSLRYINWLHNNAPLSPSDIDSVIDDGAYNVFEIGTNSYIITKNADQKYYIPNLNEWHKSAYFENLDNFARQDVSAVTVKREDPYLVGSGVDNEGLVCNTYANLSVKGWLYADHIIVGDGIIKSASRYINCSGSFAGGTGNDVVGGIGGAPATDTGTGSVSVELNADNEVIPDLSDTWVPPADVEVGRLCPNNCKEFIRTADVPLTSPLLVNATKVATSDAGDIYCICPCADNNCVALAGGGCSCLDADPPDLFEPGAEPDEIDPNNPPFDNLTGPGFFT
jgi:hypothetical protein